MLEEKSLIESSKAEIIGILSRKLINLKSPNTVLKVLYSLLKNHYSFKFLILSNPNRRPGMVFYPAKLVFSSKDISVFINDLKSQKITSDVSYHSFTSANKNPLSLGGKVIQEMLVSRIDSQSTPPNFFGMISFNKPIGLEKIDLALFQMISSIVSLKYANLELEKSVNRAETQILDDSQRLRRENDQRSELLKKIKSQTQELRLKTQEVEEFVYSVSHDLKTPVISILGFIETLKSDPENSLTPESSFYLERMESNTLHVISMIDEILDYSRMGRFTQERSVVKLTTIINESLLRFSQEIARKKIKIELDEDFPYVEVELNHMVQLFDNLIGNSIKFMGKQSSPLISISSSIQDTEYIKICVRDNGIGIPENSLSKVFNLFTRATNVSEDIEGTGIGLAQVKKIVEIHEGHIWLESQEGEGTTVTFTLPLGPSEN
jgi:signal transduction histidine kinase